MDGKIHQRRASRIFNILIVLTVLANGLAFPTPARAAGIVVNGNTDNGGLTMTVDGICSLREAIANAEMDSQQFPDCPAGSGTDTISFAGNYTITLIQGELLVTTPIIVNGNGAANTIIQGNANPNTAIYRVFEVSSAGSLTLNDLAVKNGHCDLSCSNLTNVGGGIYNKGALSISNVSIMGNRADYGGGIYNEGSAMTITNSAFSANSAASAGGGIENNDGTGTNTIVNTIFSANSAHFGGGISNTISANLSVRGSLFTSNGADNGAGISNNGSLSVSNSTFELNGAQNLGGGVYNSIGTATLTNLTMSQNYAYGLGGGIVNLNSGTLNYSNTIIANSSGNDCVNSAVLGTNQNNLVEDGNCSAALSGDPLLDSLAYHGGATNTFALLPNSPAIDAGDNAICAAAPVNNLDQRGVARPQGSVCDIGSYELDLAPTVSIEQAAGQIDPASASPINFTVTFSESVTGFTNSGVELGGTAGATIAVVTGSGSAYNVAVSGMTRAGTVTASIPANAAVDGSGYGNHASTSNDPMVTYSDLLINGGFNIFTKKIPKNWKAVKFASTDGKSTTIKKEGAGAIKIVGNGAVKTLSQTKLISGNAGESFTFSFWVKGSKIPKNSKLCQGQVKFYNGSTLKGTKTIKCPVGTFNWKFKTLTFPAPAAYNKVIVRFTYSKASGTVFFDLASLIK